MDDSQPLEIIDNGDGTVTIERLENSYPMGRKLAVIDISADEWSGFVAQVKAMSAAALIEISGKFNNLFVEENEHGGVEISNGYYNTVTVSVDQWPDFVATINNLNDGRRTSRIELQTCENHITDKGQLVF